MERLRSIALLENEFILRTGCSLLLLFSQMLVMTVSYTNLPQWASFALFQAQPAPFPSLSSGDSDLCQEEQRQLRVMQAFVWFSLGRMRL